MKQKVREKSWSLDEKRQFRVTGPDLREQLLVAKLATPNGVSTWVIRITADDGSYITLGLEERAFQGLREWLK